MIGQPMGADGFATLAAHFPDRTVVTYDPRGLGRSTRRDGTDDQRPEEQAADLHALDRRAGRRPRRRVRSSGGAVAGWLWSPPIPTTSSRWWRTSRPHPRAARRRQAAERACRRLREAYQAGGQNAGMAAFIARRRGPGQFTDAYFAQPAPDPAAFGMPTDDDGTRDDPLLSGAVGSVRRLPAGRRRPRGCADPRCAGRGRGDRRHAYRPHRPCCRRAARAGGGPCSPATTAGSPPRTPAGQGSLRPSPAACARCCRPGEPPKPDRGLVERWRRRSAVAGSRADGRLGTQSTPRIPIRDPPPAPVKG